ncbi:hypothetical protein VaNZ11_013967 [Volvox africanus]|uniref:Uncharacterized protein n=1 Tax=Volvox africanus TaxID=51714 RepID=A0ABQ5SIR4_9CHLO|nr:hypothetical protein VaNZ11_013967 [Volvox africanus]
MDGDPQQHKPQPPAWRQDAGTKQMMGAPKVQQQGQVAGAAYARRGQVGVDAKMLQPTGINAAVMAISPSSRHLQRKAFGRRQDAAIPYTLGSDETVGSGEQEVDCADMDEGKHGGCGRGAACGQ